MQVNSFSFGPQAAEKGQAGDLTEKQARELAIYLFWNVKAEFDSTEVTCRDLERLLTREQAAKCMTFLDFNGDGRVKLPEMCEAVMRVHKVGAA